MKTDFDVVIAGAGIVGSALAALLSRHPQTQSLSIVVVDQKAPADAAGDGVGLRVSALSRASQNILSVAGAWSCIADHRVSPYTRMHVWDAREGDQDDPASDGVQFDSAWLGEPDLGHIVENDLVSGCLDAVLKNSANVLQMRPWRILDASLDGEAVQLRLQHLGNDGAGASKQVSAGLVVGCDGARSQIREFAGIDVEAASYGQRGIVAVVATEKPHNEVARQRFLPGGPLALLPLATGESSIVWTCPEEQAATLMDMPDAQFEAAVTRASNGVLGDISLRSARASFPLQRLHASSYCRAGVALAGDAAHVVHPLAGQGANLGLLDAAALVQTLAGALENGERPGDLRVLRRYERWRKGDNLAMLAGLDGISRLFSSKLGPVAAFRRMGLAAVARSAPARNRLARQALGLSGDLPEAARARPLLRAGEV